MAIDSTLFAASVPAGTYAIGDRIDLGVIRGPSIVRDGYGDAILKRVVCLTDASSLGGQFSIHVKNSNWVDDLSNLSVGPEETLLADNSGAIQPGHNCRLTPNSGWEVYAVCTAATTTNAAFDLFALIDVDYPRVAAVQNPRIAEGFPVTIEFNGTLSHTVTAMGASNAAVWTTRSIDVFKAGSKYLLVEAAFRDGSNLGFISISGAAGQDGLERIIPVRPVTTASPGVKFFLDYSTPLVKGPMNLNLCSFGTAGNVTPYVYLDVVKR